MNTTYHLLVLTLSILFVAACGGGGGGGGSYHIAISHTSPGVTCEASLITLTLHDDSDHSVVAVDADKVVTLSYSPSVDAGNPTSVTVPNGESSVQFYLSQTTDIGQIDIDANNSSDGISDLDDHGSEDPYIEFRDTAFLFYADGNPVSTTAIGSQIAGLISSSNPSAQTLEIRAVETDSSTKACTSALSGTETVQIAYECKNPTSCSGSNLLSIASAVETKTVQRNNNGATLSYTDVDMSFDSNGIAGFTMNYSDAGQIKLYAKKVVAAASPDPGYTLEGSSNNVVVRPFGFDIDFSDARAADWLDNAALDGTASNTSYATGASGSAYLKAETNFTGTVSAVVWESADDSPIDGIPDTNANLTNNAVTANFGQESSAATLSFSQSLVAPTVGDGGIAGTFTASTVTAGGGSSSFTNGVATSTMNWNEVGIIDITASLADYLSDTSADITGTANDVGRFYPDHFVLTSAVGGYGNGCSSSSTDFGYIGQSFGYATSAEPTVTAIPKRAGNDSAATINNYLGDFKKLTTGAIVMETALTSTNAGVDLSMLPVTAVYGTPTLTDGGSGSESHTIFTFNSADAYTYTRSTNALVTPFAVGLPLELDSLTDTDGVKAEDGSDVDISSAAPYTFTPTATNTSQRFGRLRLENAFGPETAALNVPLNVEYYTGSEFEINTDDDCVVLAASNIDLNVIDDDSTDNSYNPAAGIITGITIDSSTTNGTIGNSPFVDGTANFTFSAPGADATAAIDMVLTNTTGVPWLLYDWDGVDQGSDSNFLDDNPSSTATFGRYRGHDRVLFWREQSN